jgi:hypothetical protein
MSLGLSVSFSSGAISSEVRTTAMWDLKITFSSSLIELIDVDLTSTYTTSLLCLYRLSVWHFPPRVSDPPLFTPLISSSVRRRWYVSEFYLETSRHV